MYCKFYVDAFKKINNDGLEILWISSVSSYFVTGQFLYFFPLIKSVDKWKISTIHLSHLREVTKTSDVKRCADPRVYRKSNVQIFECTDSVPCPS